jgi:hypothetical protein
MKKYGMLVLSILIFLLTASTYIYENTNLASMDYKEPTINFKSKKFGDIRNIIWANYGNTREPHLFILAENVPNADRDLSFIHNLDITTGKYHALTSIQRNENFRDLMEYRQWEAFYTASKHGIEVIKPQLDPVTGRVFANRESYSIPNFNDADSITIQDKIYYTKSTDKLLYIQDIPGSGFFNYQSGPSANRTLYIPADKVLSSPNSRIIYYTKREKDGINAYMLDNRTGFGGIKHSLVAKNFVYSKRNVFLSEEFLALTDEGDKFGILYKGNLIGTTNKNTDLMGQIPDLQIRDVNNTYNIIYTSFKGNNIGSIYNLSSSSSEPIEIVKDQPIVGPLRLSLRGDKTDLLFFTYENNQIRIKICKIDGTELRDITEYIK